MRPARPTKSRRITSDRDATTRGLFMMRPEPVAGLARPSPDDRTRLRGIERTVGGLDQRRLSCRSVGSRPAHRSGKARGHQSGRQVLCVRYAGGVHSSGTSPKLSYLPAKPVDFFGSMTNIAQTAVATSAGLSSAMRLHPRREVKVCGASKQNSDPSPFGISDWSARWTSPGRRTVRWVLIAKPTG
jgi:hypothetical protein